MLNNTVHPSLDPRSTQPPGRQVFRGCCAVFSTGCGFSLLTERNRRGGMLRRAAAWLLLSLLAAPPVCAASLSGTVVDPEGRLVPAARVTLLSALDAVEERTTGPEGQYRFEDLDRGSYKLTANAAGLSASAIEVELDASQNRNLDLHLKLSAVEQQVV